jgi:pimeloyl-ACP methyl ester carboxylesterase
VAGGEAIEVGLRHGSLLASLPDACGEQPTGKTKEDTVPGVSVVFVHGVPETAALWDGVRNRIDRESVALTMPGFGTPRPEGFGATKDDYAAWLVAELEGIDGPIDLVGHDWGALLAARVATTRGELLHSWLVDVANVFHPDYVWHDVAQVWQTPDQGEEFMDSQLGIADDSRGDIFIGFGVPEAEARTLGRALDRTMSRCILDLYRSAVPNTAKDWGDSLAPTTAPGMLLVPTDDPFCDEKLSREVAGQVGARVELLEGLGHWWMLQDPDRAAAALVEFWNSVG